MADITVISRPIAQVAAESLATMCRAGSLPLPVGSADDGVSTGDKDATAAAATAATTVVTRHAIASRLMHLMTTAGRAEGASADKAAASRIIEAAAICLGCLAFHDDDAALRKRCVQVDSRPRTCRLRNRRMKGQC